MSDCAAARAAVWLDPPPARYDTMASKRSSGDLVVSFEKQVVTELWNKIMLYASLRVTVVFCPAALRAVWRETQNPWRDEYTEPSLLLLYRLILVVDGLFSRGRRSVKPIELDLLHVSTPTFVKGIGIPVNHKDACGLLEMSGIKMLRHPRTYIWKACLKTTGFLHMNTCPSLET